MTKQPSWIDRHLWQIVGMVMAAYIGFLTATSSAAAQAEKVTSIDARIGKLEQRLSGRGGFMTDSKDRLEYLCNRDRECRERFDPMKVPE